MPKKESFRYDRVLKDLFQQDRPSLLDSVTGGVRVKKFLNVEFTRMMERRADLVALLDNDVLLNFEIQGQNAEIRYRSGHYCLLIAEEHQRPVRQVVLYVGEEKMQMKSRLDAGSTKVELEIIDIREFDAKVFLRSGRPGDLALAMLAKGGIERLTEILQKAVKLSGRARERVFTQLLLLMDLRKVPGKYKMEVKNMAWPYIDISKNEILSEWLQAAEAKAMARGMAEGEARGEARGEAKARVEMLRGLLQTKFGKLPKWASQRLQSADQTQIDLWAKNTLSAQDLEGAIGKK
jgi:hypothetical protein